MKKLSATKITILLLVLCFTFFGVLARPFVANASTDNVVMVFWGIKQKDDKITVDVDVKENSGVYSMLLTLDYDADAFDLESVVYGDAMKSLEPLSSKSYSVFPYKITYMGKTRSNDTSTGRLMSITFAVKENAVDGDYAITFGYEKDKDVTYLADGEIKTKNLVISGTKVTLKNSGVEKIVTESAPQNDNGTLWLILSISVAVVCVVALVVVIIVRKRRRKWKRI